MKSLLLAPSNRVVQVPTESNVLQALLSERVPVKLACGGKGLCATCHVYIEQGAAGLSPRTKREERTLAVLGESRANSRLACQAKVINDGVIVELPEGLYVTQDQDLFDLVGRRTESRILHPLDGRVLLPAGKIITRSVVQRMGSVETDLAGLFADSHQV